MTPVQELFLLKIGIFKKVFLIGAIVAVISFLAGAGRFATGFIAGGLISICIFSLLYKYVLAMRGLDAGARRKFIIPRALLVYAIMGITLFISIKKGMPVFLGAVLGMFSLKLAIFAQAFREKGENVSA